MSNKCLKCLQPFHKKYKSQKFCSLVCSNRFNLNNKNKVDLPKFFNEDLAEFFGILLGDGGVTKYFLKIYLNRIVDKEYAPFVYSLGKKLFPGASITNTDRENEGTKEIQISSKDVCDYLINIGFNRKKRDVPLWILRKESFVKSAIKGLFDTEGCISTKRFKTKKGEVFYHQLTFTNSSPHLLLFIEKELKKLKFRPTEKSKKNIYISNRKDILRYFAIIGSHNPKLTNKILRSIL